jgi:hypothetical protein
MSTHYSNFEGNYRSHDFAESVSMIWPLKVKNEEEIEGANKEIK